jgi:hypothetical protein
LRRSMNDSALDINIEDDEEDEEDENDDGVDDE